MSQKTRRICYAITVLLLLGSAWYVHYSELHLHTWTIRHSLVNLVWTMFIIGMLATCLVVLSVLEARASHRKSKAKRAQRAAARAAAAA